MDRANADGEYDLPIFNQARLVTVGGNFYAKNHEQMHEAGNFLTAAMLGRLQVTMHGKTQWADAKRNSGIRFTPITDVIAQWQLRLKCPDPRKYGDTQSFPLSSEYTNLFHWGNYRASPIVTVTGNAPGGYTIQEPGGVSYQVTGQLLPGQTHTVDFRTGVFRINGYIISGQTGITDIWYIEPGNAKGMRVTSAGTVNATATVTDTFI